MERLGEYISYDNTFLENAMAFLMRYQLLGIDSKCLLLEKWKDNKKLENLLSNYLALSVVNNPQIIIPKKLAVEEVVTLANDILISMLPFYEKELLKYDDLIYFYDDFSIDFSCLNYQLTDDAKIIPDSIDLSSNLNEYSIGTINHEKMHVLVFEKIPLKQFSGIYIELLPMLFQKITNDIVEKKILSNQTTIIDSIIRAKDNQSQVRTLDYLREINLSTESINNHFVYQYLNLKSNDYLLSNWYSELLFKYYLSDSLKMKEKIKQVFYQEITIQELLNYYQISLDNNELFSCINNQLKEVKKYIIKP